MQLQIKAILGLAGFHCTQENCDEGTPGSGKANQFRPVAVARMHCGIVCIPVSFGDCGSTNYPNVELFEGMVSWKPGNGPLVLTLWD